MTERTLTGVMQREAEAIADSVIFDYLGRFPAAVDVSTLRYVLILAALRAFTRADELEQA